METKIKDMAEDIVELDEIGNLQKYFGKLNKTLAAANIREDRDSRVAELKWLYQIKTDESEKQKLVIKIKSIISSEIKVDTDSDDEQVVKIVRRQNTPQSAIALDVLPPSVPSPILEDWNNDNESYSHLVIDDENFNESSVLFNRYISESEHISSARTLETEQISESPDFPLSSSSSSVSSSSSSSSSSPSSSSSSSSLSSCDADELKDKEIFNLCLLRTKKKKVENPLTKRVSKVRK